MKIAMVSPLDESVPPQSYGGTERCVYFLTEELINLGHEVTLFASSDSRTRATLVSPFPEELRSNLNPINLTNYHIRMLEMLSNRADEFDLIHFNTSYVHLPFARRIRTPHVTTLHGRLDLYDLVALHREYKELPMISISDSQRDPIPWANWIATIYHGLPADLFQLNEQGGDYLAFLGRVSPEKGLDRAIEIAKMVNMPLKISARINDADREYFAETIEPLLRHPLIEYIGEKNDAQKNDFLGRARALLFPINWCEPFGLVMIEAMACGTPIVAWNCGSVPEVMEGEVTGFIVDNLDDAASAVRRIEMLDRRHCREVFERRFLSTRMAHNYLSVYRKIIADAGKC